MSSQNARSPEGQMWVILLSIRVMTLFALVAIALSACGSSQATTPTPVVVGPALIFFYTDN